MTRAQHMASTPVAMKWRRRRLLTEAMDAHVEWRNECSAVWVAYSYWEAARVSDAALCYAAYVAALDREERAAELYSSLMRRVRDLVGADLEPVADLAAAGGGR